MGNFNEKIQMVDLVGQYNNIKIEIDNAIQGCINEGAFINGPQVKTFQQNLEKYLGVKKVITCANGTDALQIALMSMNLKQGDGVIVPAFTYAATAEVIALLGLVPQWIDVNEDDYLLNTSLLEKTITPISKVIIPVHLYGQCANMEVILAFAKAHNLHVIEDCAQSIGSEYSFSNGQKVHSGTMGDFGCTSFFPSKNLGCFGDGGAMYTNNEDLGKTAWMISNHGQQVKYYHEIVGINSRLDTIQAAVLDVKLKYLNKYIDARQKAASYYHEQLKELSSIITPVEQPYSTHVYHQFTIVVKNGKRNQLKAFLEANGIPSMIHYPLPLHLQNAYKSDLYKEGSFPNAEHLAQSVLSLPIHTELSESTQKYICDTIKKFEF